MLLPVVLGIVAVGGGAGAATGSKRSCKRRSCKGQPRGIGGQAEDHPGQAVVSQAFMLCLALLAADDKKRALEAAEKDKKGALQVWYFLDVSLWLSHALANGEAMDGRLAQEVQQNIQA